MVTNERDDDHSSSRCSKQSVALDLSQRRCNRHLCDRHLNDILDRIDGGSFLDGSQSLCGRNRLFLPDHGSEERVVVIFGAEGGTEGGGDFETGGSDSDGAADDEEV